MVILSGQDVLDKLRQCAINNHTLTEVLIEQINEVALECIGDNIIETGNSLVYIYDDYRADLLRVIEGEE